MKCPRCSLMHPSNLKQCPRCGIHVLKKRIFPIIFFSILGVIIFTCLVTAIVFPLSQNSSSHAAVTSQEAILSDNEYKAECIALDYNSLSRYPDDNLKTRVKFTGKVIQVQENGNKTVLRINTTKGEYDIWDDTIWANYTLKKGEAKILEDDVVECYGLFVGTKKYSALLGNEISVPEINAKIINIKAND